MAEKLLICRLTTITDLLIKKNCQKDFCSSNDKMESLHDEHQSSGPIPAKLCSDP